MPALTLLLDRTIQLSDKTIIEPINAPVPLTEKLRPFFPEQIFNLNPQSILYKLMSALLGDAGVGEIKKAFLYPRLANALANTDFNDLNALFGSPLNLPRLNDEIYTYDPRYEVLTQEEWQEVRRKDAWYRARCLDYMQAIQLGNTPEGIRLLVRAATGLDCEIFEHWKYLDDQLSDEPLGLPNLGKTASPNEIVVRPLVDELGIADQRRINRAIDRLKPANMLITTDAKPSPRAQVDIADIASSSDFFQVKRLVTGNFAINYPTVDTTQGLWIETGVEKEAPKQAYNEHSETVTYPSIVSASASTFHVGPFNAIQQGIFLHLRDIPDPLYQFNANESFSTTPLNLEVTAPWINRSGYSLINEYFPMGYFADPNAPIPNFAKQFWASQERIPPTSEELTLDLGSSRIINIIEFEIASKPLHIDVEYWTGSAWVTVDFDTNIENKRDISYHASSPSWENVQLNFVPVTTTKVKLIFTRKEVRYPYDNSEIFPWSVDVRRLRVAHSIVSITDFIGTPDPLNPNILVGDSGTDILGNAYRTTLDPTQYAAAKITDGAVNTFWQSQANPSRFAVESVYLDISDGDEPVLIDEIYTDPITTGPLMHIYYSDDAIQPDWDLKLWTPISRHYILRKGFHKLPAPIKTRYIKLEFTKLHPVPYNVPQLVRTAPIRYRQHPTWVTEYIENLYKPVSESLFNTITGNQVKFDYEILGLKIPETTKLTPEIPKSIEEFIQENTQYTNLAEYQTWKARSPGLVNQTRNEVIIYPNNLYQADLVSSLRFNSYLDRYLFSQESAYGIFRAEAPLVPRPLIAAASKSDREAVKEELTYPDTWFPRRCRHGYKVIESNRDFKLAYIVGLREVKVYYTPLDATQDNLFYNEILANESYLANNSFNAFDWRYVVSSSLFGIAQSSSIFSEVGNETFDQFTSHR